MNNLYQQAINQAERLNAVPLFRSLLSVNNEPTLEDMFEQLFTNLTML